MKNCNRLILSALVILALPLMGIASAQNILVNPGFETGDLTGWTTSGGNASAGVTVQAGDNGPTLSGNNNAFMENLGEAIGLNLRQVTPVGSAGPGLVSYSFDLKLDQADAGGVVFVEIYAEQDGAGIVGGSGLMGPLWPWNNWTNYAGSFVAPAGTDFLSIRFEAATGAATGTSCVLHVDNVVLESEGAVPNDETSLSTIKALYR